MNMVHEILHIVIYGLCDYCGKTKHMNYNAIPCSIAITEMCDNV